MVEQLSAFARANLAHARLLDGSQVPPETPEELARPIIPADLARQTVARGRLSGEMDVCGMDWADQSFRPYMQRLRASGGYTDKQFGYLGLLHGFSQGSAMRDLASAEPCTDADRRSLSRTVTESPILTP